jgi:hypothetical protein
MGMATFSNTNNRGVANVVIPTFFKQSFRTRMLPALGPRDSRISLFDAYRVSCGHIGR